MLKILILYFLVFLNANAQEQSSKNTNNSDISKMLSFAKESLIANTQNTKIEFGIKDEPSKEEKQQFTLEQKYSTQEWRDIFLSQQYSTLINQAYDYHKQGKKMNLKKESFKTEQVEKVVKPLIAISSLMFNTTEHWTVFTNIGKFTYKKPFIKDIKITGISTSQVELIVPITKDISPTVSELKSELQHRQRIFIEGRNLILQLRTGECVFESDLQITTRCKPIIKKIEKQVAI